MNICKGIKIQDLALFFEKEKVLVLGDLHIGEEAAMKRDGVLIPRFQQKDLINKTKKILAETKPKLIVLNGDVKHEFGGISREEWKQVLDYLDILQKHSKVVIIKGNHDKIIDPIADKKGIPVLDHYSINPSTYVCHGDIIPKNDEYKKAKTIIIGHEHPAIGLREGNRVEKYKCFLKGKYDKKTLIVMPSMNQLTEGTDVLTEKLLSPFLNKIKLDNFETWIIESEIYHFGKLRGLKRK